MRCHSSSWKAGELAVGGMERVGVGKADARHEVPVVAGPTGHRQRRARGGDVQAPLRIKRVGERQQVVLVGAAPVVQDEQPQRVRRGRALAER